MHFYALIFTAVAKHKLAHLPETKTQLRVESHVTLLAPLQNDKHPHLNISRVMVNLVNSLFSHHEMSLLASSLKTRISRGFWGGGGGGYADDLFFPSSASEQIVIQSRKKCTNDTR